jgi:hypothetical protein
VLARDRNTAIYPSDRVALIAGKHRSHIEPSLLRHSAMSGTLCNRLQNSGKLTNQVGCQAAALLMLI